jgi:hypothetical protein
LIEAHVRAQGQAAQFTYHGILGGTDAAVTVGKRVELTTRKFEGVTQLAVLAETSEAADEALGVLAGLEVEDDDQARVLAAFERALAATRDRWPALERDAPTSRQRGHTIDPATGGLHPTHSRPPAEPAAFDRASACDWLADPGCEIPCQVLELISIADVGCL